MTSSETRASPTRKADSGRNDSLDSGLQCVALMAALFGKPVEAARLAHDLGLTATAQPNDLLKALKRLELKAQTVKAQIDRLDRTPLPAIALDREGNHFILAKISDDGAEVLIQDPALRRPEKIHSETLLSRWTGELILITSRAKLAGDERTFDVSWFIPAVVRYRKLFGEVLVASFFLQLFALVTPLFFQVIIDKVLTHGSLTTLDVLIFALIVVSIFEVILGGLRTYIFSHTAQRIDVTLGARLFQHLMRLPMAYFVARRVGDTVARVRELETIRNFLTGSALTLIIDLAFTVVFFAVMYYFAPLLTWIVLGSIPFYVIVSLTITPSLRSRVEEKFQRGAENQAFLVESVTGVETLKAMAVEPQMQRRWEEQLAGYVSATFRAGNLSNWVGQTVQGIQKITMALTLYWGAILVVSGDLTVGQLVAFNMLSARVAQPVLRLAQLWQDFQQAQISLKKLGDILNAPAEPSMLSGRGALPVIKGNVNFDQVNFRYRPDGQEILKRVSLSVPAGQVVGIVGPSGSGKSTLTKLIQRLYVPESGRVMIDGTDLALVDPASLRRQVGVVLQENTLFNRPVRDNIALANPALPLEAIQHAAGMAGAHEFICELPEGYDTIIGERGTTLSGGQRQRIAIARALVSNPRILILDEATSALDYESELAIQKNMTQICKGRTVFVIAHRLSTVRGCDRIITIEAGQIVEDGTHTSLVKAGGRYAKLWAAQSDIIPGQKPAQPPQTEIQPGQSFKIVPHAGGQKVIVQNADLSGTKDG